MPLILDRMLSGWNQVVETTDDFVQNHPGIEPFPKFLKAMNLTPAQLSEFLKIPLDKLERLNSERGYIRGDAARNIRDFYQLCRDPNNYRSPVDIYQSHQHGELEEIAEAVKASSG